MSSKSTPVDDILVFKPEPENTENTDYTEPWKILVVDDDEQVHKVTSLALSDVKILQRPLSFLHAYSAAEAKGILKNEQDIAVIILDVVMEKDDSGLELARIIRTEFRLEAPRIILRTGQPGYAPELEVIQAYDINDYRMKNELTRTRLITAMTTAIRSYQQVHMVRRGEEGMRHIISATNSLFKAEDHDAYALSVITQCAELLGIDHPDGLLCIRMQAIGSGFSQRNLYVSAVRGSFGNYADISADEIPDTTIRTMLYQSVDEGRSIFNETSVCLFIDNEEGKQAWLYLKTPVPVDDLAKNLLEVFAVSIGIGFKNIRLISQLNQYAYYDQLTRLPNRTRFILDISRGYNGPEQQFAAVLDIDDFSEINNALGHRNGDLLLQAISDRLVNSLPSSLVIARIGGDTFGIAGQEQLIHPALLLKPFERPFVIKNTPFPVTATVGLAPINRHNPEGMEILKNANMAMKIAKLSQSSSYLYYTEEMTESAEQRLEITRDLHPALSRDEFVIYYQPQINVSSQRMSGVECLVRWQKPDGTIIPPVNFIPVAESTGLIIELGKQIFRKACEQARIWMESDSLDFRIAINVSVRQFLDPDFISSLKTILRDEEMEARYFELEITESILMNEIESMIAQLEELRDLGFLISIDDFGTAYSSLNYLLRLPIHRLKIDRSFIMNVENDERARTLSELIVNTANNLGLLTIAEGIETSGQLDFIRKLGCNDVQGYLYSKPLDVDNFNSWYANYRNGGGI